MKRVAIFSFMIFIVSVSYGQQNEYSIQLNSGLFSFRGIDAAHNSVILGSSSFGGYYTNDPYGAHSAISVGLSLQAQRITRANLVFGAQLGYERLRSKVFIDKVYVSEDIINPEAVEAKGKTILNLDFITLYPHFGKRFHVGAVYLQMTLGTDLGFGLGSREHGKATTVNGVEVTTDRERSVPDLDFRLRGDITAYYKSYGIYTGYSSGLTNYKADLIGSNQKVYARFWRFGLTYKL